MKRIRIIGSQLELLDDRVYPNINFIANSNVHYSLFWDKQYSKFHCFKSDNKSGWVAYNDCPEEIVYELIKPIEEFTDEEKSLILDYRGLKLGEDGFCLADIWMQGDYIKLVNVYK